MTVTTELLSVGDIPPALLNLGAYLAGADPRSNDASEVAAAKLGSEASGALHLYVAYRSEQIEELAADAATHLERALVWLWEHRHHPWIAPFDERRQLWVSRRREHPTPKRFVSPNGYWGQAVFRPPQGGLWTSTELQPNCVPWLDELAGDPQPIVWALSPHPDARVYTVGSLSDWQALVAAFPRRVEAKRLTLDSGVVVPGPLYLPTWEKVQQHWDAVRFTLSGKLRTLYVPAPLEDGFTILHESTGAEETLWLNWAFAHTQLFE